MEYIESIIQILQFPGKIRMKNPSLQFSLVFDYGHIGESIIMIMGIHILESFQMGRDTEMEHIITRTVIILM